VIKNRYSKGIGKDFQGRERKYCAGIEFHKVYSEIYISINKIN
jgi:hypothetical protein